MTKNSSEKIKTYSKIPEFTKLMPFLAAATTGLATLLATRIPEMNPSIQKVHEIAGSLIMATTPFLIIPVLAKTKKDQAKTPQILNVTKNQLGEYIITTDKPIDDLMINNNFFVNEKNKIEKINLKKFGLGFISIGLGVALAAMTSSTEKLEIKAASSVLALLLILGGYLKASKIKSTLKTSIHLENIIKNIDNNKNQIIYIKSKDQGNNLKGPVNISN